MNFNISALGLIVPLALVCLIGGKGYAIAEIIQDDIDEMTKDVEERAAFGDADIDVDGSDKNTQSLMMDKYIEEVIPKIRKRVENEIVIRKEVENEIFKEY